MKKRICFVDDDHTEIERFRRAFGDHLGGYIVGAGTTLEAALRELEESGHKKPDLFLLDMYYGPTISDETRQQIADADEAVSKAEKKLRVQLTKAGITQQKGFELADSVKRKLGQVPIAFFSRKAFLEDALTAQKKGLPVIEKPDPNDSDSGTQEQRYDAAMMRAAEILSIQFNEIISRESWWNKHHSWFSGLASGFFFLLLTLLLEMLKSGSSVGHQAGEFLLTFALVGCIAVAWRWQ